MTSRSDGSDPIRLGVAGLGRAFMLMLPTFVHDPRIALVAAAAPRAESRRHFEERFGGRAYDSVEALCADPDVEAIYVATPHEMHADHVAAATAAGKHLLVDKPLCVSLADGQAMVAAAQAAGVHLIVGPSHSFDGPIGQAVALIDSGDVGAVRMIQTFNYTDFLYRPRRPEELDTAQGGGVVFSQAVHQADIVRLLGGGQATTVCAMTGDWDPARPTEGAYAALIGFKDGAFASITYSGYGRFDSDIWCDDIGELGRPKPADAYGRARRMLASASPDGEAESEAALKRTRTFGSAAEADDLAPFHEHFGPLIVSCERADLQVTPKGVWLCGDAERRLLPLPTPDVPRREIIDALVGAVRHNRPLDQTAAWGLASLEICHAVLDSARTGAVVRLHHQVPRTTAP